MEIFVDWKHPVGEFLLGIKVKYSEKTLILRRSYQNKYLVIEEKEFLDVLLKDKEERKISNLKELANLKKLKDEYLQHISLEKFFSKRELFYLQYGFYQELGKMGEKIQEYIYRFPLLEKRIYEFLSQDFISKEWLLSVAEKLRLSYSNFRQWIESWIEIVKQSESEKIEKLRERINNILKQKEKPTVSWNKVKEELTCFLFPHFSSYKREFEKLKNKMAKGKVKLEVETDPSFESGIFLFKAALRSYEDYCDLIEELKNKKDIVKCLFLLDQKV